MLLIVPRPPQSDVRVWPGRRALAVVDAVAFPALCVWIIARLPVATGAVGSFVIALSVFLSLKRMSRAWFRNERYRFTSARWAVVLSMAILFGVAIKLAIAMQVMA